MTANNRMFANALEIALRFLMAIQSLRGSSTDKQERFFGLLAVNATGLFAVALRGSLHGLQSCWRKNFGGGRPRRDQASASLTLSKHAPDNMHSPCNRCSLTNNIKSKCLYASNMCSLCGKTRNFAIVCRSTRKDPTAIPTRVANDLNVPESTYD